MAVSAYRKENEVLRSNCDHLSSENASLASQVESMAMRIESLADELAKPEDVRLREVIDELDGRAVIFDSLAGRVGAILDELDEVIARAGSAERTVEVQKKLLVSAQSIERELRRRLSDAEERLAHLLRELDECIERAGAAERRLEKAEEVVMLARQLTAYSWEDRLDDCEVSDAARQDSRELSIAVWLYDQEFKP
jgi:chromosome segregation ATPase